jgi:hypothetical protein
MFVGKVGAYPIEETYRCSTVGSRLLAMLANNSLGWKGLLGTNILTYYKNS